MKREDYVSLSGADYIRGMFASTQEDTSLTIEEEEECVTWYMDWSETDMEQIVARYETLLDALTRLGKEHERWASSVEGMPEDLLEVWNTYVAPYPDHDMDPEKLFEASLNAECGITLTPEEQTLLEKKYAWMAKHAEERLPYNRCTPLFMIDRARWYERLVSFHAPALVVEEAARGLAEELALYYGLLAVC